MSFKKEAKEILSESDALLKSINDLKAKPTIFGNLADAACDYYKSMNKIMNYQKTLMHESDTAQMAQKRYMEATQKANDFFSKIGTTIPLFCETATNIAPPKTTSTEKKKSGLKFSSLLFYALLITGGFLTGIFFFTYRRNPTHQHYYNKYPIIRDDIF